MSIPVPGCFCHFKVPAKPSSVTCRGRKGTLSWSPFAEPSISLRPCRSPAVAHVAQGVTHGVFWGQSRLQFVVWALFVADALPLFVQSKGHSAICVTVTPATSRTLHMS